MPSPTDKDPAEIVRELAAGDEAFERILGQALLRPLAKAISDDDGSDPSPILIHVRDWLRADVAEGAHWLSRLDRNGVPVKLAKLATLKQANDEADKSMRRRLSRGSSAHAEPSAGTEIAMLLEGGWSVVRLMTNEALDYESHTMQHCIGHGAYDERLEDGSGAFYSLRDPSGRPHVTVEVSMPDRKLHQIQGKQNEIPILEHARRMRPFLANGIVVDNGQCEATRIFVDADDAQHDWDRLPETIEVDRHADLSGYRGPLPGKIVCRGTFVLPPPDADGVFDCEIHAGSLTIEEGDVRRFARPLYVRGTLSISHSPLEELHPGSHVGTLVIDNLPNLNSLPDAITLGSSISIDNVPLTRLPASVGTLSALTLKDCPISELPEGTRVNGALSILRCPIRRFPDDMVVRGRLSLEDVPVDRLPRIEGRLTTLVLIDCPVRELPDDLEIGYKTRIHSCPIAEFPSDMRVEGTLHLADVPAPRLPSGILELTELVLSDCGIAELNPLLHVRGGTSIARCPVRVIPGTARFGGGFSYVGDDLVHVEGNSFGGDVSISTWRAKDRLDAMGLRSDHLSVDAGLRVAGELSLLNVKLHHGLPDGLRAGSLKILQGLIGRGGSDIVIAGDVEIHCNRMETLPRNFVCEGDLKHSDGWLAEIGAGTRIDGDLKVSRNTLLSIPDDVSIGGRIVVPLDCVVEIGTGFRVGALDASGFGAQAVFPDGMRVGSIDNPELMRGRLPKNLRVDGDLDLSGFLPEEIPEGLSVSGRLDLPEETFAPSF